MGVLKQVILTIILAMIVQKVAHLVYLFGFHKKVLDHAPGPCRLVDGIDLGSEDMQVLSNGLVLISSGLRFADPHRQTDQHKDKVGRIYKFDFKKPNQKPMPLEIKGKLDLQDFNPHGLSAWEDKKTGQVTLLVVNHPSYGERVEKFTFDPKDSVLQHVESIQDEGFYMLNDIVAVGADSFYWTNFHYFSNHMLWNLELLLPNLGTVGFHDGNRGRLLLSGLISPNGINKSPDGKFIYVADALAQEILVYTRTEDNSLAMHNHIHINTFPDNIEVDPKTGHIWSGAHPVGWKAKRHIEDRTKAAPSQILHIKMKDGKAEKIYEVYAEDNGKFFASSVATVYGNLMLAGSVQHTTLFCEIRGFELYSGAGKGAR